MSERPDFSYKLLNDQRTKAGWTMSIGSEQVQTQELKDRLRLNEIINPIVSALREVYGVQHKIGDNGVSFERGRVTDMIMDAKGPFRLVPNCDPHLADKCSKLALALLHKKLTKMGLVTNEEKDKVVKEILVNRFYEDDEVGDTNNLSKLLCFCVEESMHGYNAVEVQQKKKQMEKEKEEHEMEENDDDDEVDYLALLEAFATSQVVQDRLASQNIGTGKKGKGSKK